MAFVHVNAHHRARGINVQSVYTFSKEGGLAPALLKYDRLEELL